MLYRESKRKSLELKFMDTYSQLNDKIVLITGGTGSFGNDTIETILNTSNPKEIRVFSRDEKKQFDMRNRLKSPLIKFLIGDVRDRDSVSKVMRNVDYVFHAAALKQVPTCEFFPIEAVKTNILGTNNVLEEAENNNVIKVVVLSTDKAVYPINAMGMTKAILEKIMLAKAREANGSRSSTKFCGVRYGNVMCSRGSVIPLFIEQMQNHQMLTITNPDMTRFLLPLPRAVGLVLYALDKGMNGDMLIRKSPACTMDILAHAMIEIFNYNKGIQIIGIREGEKTHETLVTREELIKAEDMGDFFRIENFKKLDYDKFFGEGKISSLPKEGYTSENTKRLSLDETKNLLLSLKEVQSALK
jgi:UDP-N-acetylglucosamine 4,6-dehydratase/5-epimerase